MEDEHTLVVMAGDNNLAEVQRLLDIGVDPNTPNAGDPSALLYAADNANVEMVKLLLAKGANVNHQCEVNGSTLECACAVGSKEIVELFLNAGVDVNARSYLGATALGYAKHHGHAKIVELLKTHGAIDEDDFEFKQYDFVEILNIHKLEGFNLDKGINRRKPQLGDRAFIIEIYSKPYSGYELECSDSEGVSSWMHAFKPEDIELKLIKRSEQVFEYENKPLVRPVQVADRRNTEE